VPYVDQVRKYANGSAIGGSLGRVITLANGGLMFGTPVARPLACASG
jgi:hypothetical protein